SGGGTDVRPFRFAAHARILDAVRDPKPYGPRVSRALSDHDLVRDVRIVDRNDAPRDIEGEPVQGMAESRLIDRQLPLETAERVAGFDDASGPGCEHGAVMARRGVPFGGSTQQRAAGMLDTAQRAADRVDDGAPSSARD